MTGTTPCPMQALVLPYTLVRLDNSIIL